MDSDITTCTSDLTHEVVENEVGILVAHEQTGADKRRPLSLDFDLPVGDVLLTSWSHSYTGLGPENGKFRADSFAESSESFGGT